MRDEYSSGVNANVDDERDRHLNMGGGLVPYDTKPSDNQAPEPLRFGVFWCLAAGAVAGYIPVLASFAGAYGTCLCTYQKGWKRILAALISLLAPSVAIALLVPSLRVGDVVVPTLVGFAFGLLTAKKRLNGNTVALTSAAAVAMLIGSDAVSSAATGTTLSQNMASLINEAVSAANVGGDPQMQAMADRVRESLSLYWPLLYGVVAVVYGFCAWLGVVMFTHSVTFGSEYKVQFRTFEAPMWILAIMVVGFAIYIAQRNGTQMPREVVFIGLNLMQGARFFVVLQGLALTVWFLASHGVGKFGQALAFIFGIQLEYSFFVMSVFGFVDGLAHFRDWPKKDKSDGQA